MPNAATQGGAPTALIPFVNGAHEHVELVNTVTFQPGANPITLGPFDIPPYGYLRNVYLELTTITAGTGGTLAADGPAAFLSNVSLTDVNGGNIINPIDGYSLMWSNIITGGSYQPDPRQWPSYSSSPTSPGIHMRLPLEITSFDGFGSLANQDSSATYKMYATVPASTALYSVAPTTAPIMQLNIWAECWTIPNDKDMLGNPQQQAPPGLGSARYITSNIQPVLAGANTLPHKRVGNLLETVCLIARTSAGVRSDTVFPNPFTMRWDSREVYQNVSIPYLRNLYYQATQPVSADAGVLVLQFNKGTLQRAGNGPLRQLLGTVQSSRIEYAGNAAAAGSLQIVTHDLSVVEIDASDRYVLDSATGFHPEVGQQVAGAM